MSGRTLYDIFEADGGTEQTVAASPTKAGHRHGFPNAAPVSTTIAKGLVDRIDAAARARGISRLAMVRQLVEAGADALGLP